VAERRGEAPRARTLPPQRSTTPGRRSAALTALLAATPARLAIGRAGPRMRSDAYLDFLREHATRS